MKTLVLICICVLLFPLKALTQTGNDQRILIVECTEDSEGIPTRVSIETGGLTGTMIFGRIDRGDFHSGDIIVKLFDGISIPESRTYVDVETQGNTFLLTYDFINKDQYGTLIYHGDLKTLPSTDRLICLSPNPN